MTLNPADFSLEEALRNLDQIVRQLESGDLSLDEALTLFEQGQALVKRCEGDLDTKELRIQQIMADDSLAPFER